MGSKYRPSIKDQKAALRYQQAAVRTAANGPVKRSVFITARPAPTAPQKSKE
jgi:hypothetical protein